MKTSKKKRQKRDPLDTLYRKRDRALERVVALWDKSGAPDDDPEELNRALDVLTLAHASVTFAVLSG